MLRNRRAKIIATVGPASAAPFMLRNLFNKGVDTFRLNFSHGDHASHAAVIRAIRALETEVGVPIGILQDLQGPKIRLGRLPGGCRVLDRHERVFFTLTESTEAITALPLPHAEVFAAIAPGHRLFIDDGRVRLRVVSAIGERIEAEVLEGGKVSDRKGVNLPDTLLELPVLTEKDRADLEFGLDHLLCMVALSFVQRASDLDEIRELIAGRAGLVSKIEKPSALVEIETIVQSSEAIMIARGDLGVEIPPEDVPGRQKEIITLCRRESRPVIVATQMLESMTASPMPTRAEASDVATAIYDGTDAVMLSAESATGAFPVEAVEVMDRIIRRTEAQEAYGRSIAASREAPIDAAGSIADAGAKLACALRARCLVAYSVSGTTAHRVAARRPALPLIVVTKETSVSRRMALVWGVRSVLETAELNYDSMVSMAREESARLIEVAAGDTCVILAGVPFGQTGSTNNLRVARYR